MKKRHFLKCWPEYFQLIWDGKKLYEMRLNDRDYRVGDTLIIDEYCPKNNVKSTRQILASVIHILEGECFGLKKGWVIMSLDPNQIYTND